MSDPNNSSGVPTTAETLHNGLACRVAVDHFNLVMKCGHVPVSKVAFLGVLYSAVSNPLVLANMPSFAFLTTDRALGLQSRGPDFPALPLPGAGCPMGTPQFSIKVSDDRSGSSVSARSKLSDGSAGAQ